MRMTILMRSMLRSQIIYGLPSIGRFSKAIETVQFQSRRALADAWKGNKILFQEIADARADTGRCRPNTSRRIMREYATNMVGG